MRTTTVNIAFPISFLEKIDQMASMEDRNRSEFLREAVRVYIERKKDWDRIFEFADRRTRQMKLKKKDIDPAIRNVRLHHRA